MQPFQIRSSIPGRVRWAVPGLIDQPPLGRAIEHAFSALGGTKSVRASPVSGRVLLEYRQGADLKAFEGLLAEVIAGRWRAPAPTAEPKAVREEGENPLLHLLMNPPAHRALTQRALAIAFMDRMFEAAPPALIGGAIDIVTRGPASLFGRLGLPTVRLQLMALGTIGAIVWTLDSVMNYYHTVTTTELATTVQRDLRNDVYRHLQTLDIGQLEAQAVSDWLFVLQNDIDRVEAFVEDGLDPIITILTNSLIVGATFLSISPVLAAVQLFSVPGLYFVTTQLLKPIRKQQAVAHTDQKRLSALLHGNVAGMPTIAGFASQNAEAGRVEAVNAQSTDSTQRMNVIRAAYIPAIKMVVGASFLTTLCYGGVLVNRGAMSVASLNIMGQSSMKLLVALARLGISVEQYQRMMVSLNRVNALLERRPAVAGGETPLTPADAGAAITFEDVVFGYAPDRPVLRGLSLRFPAGQTVGVVGSTGTGKTTILKLLSRFYDIQSGSIKIGGTDIREFCLDGLRESMATVPQQIFLFYGTVRENIAYARPDAPPAAVESAARVAQAHDFIEALPQGYDTLVGEGGAKLSGGQQQRLAIARAVLADRPILLFDEATSAMDYETEAAIQQSLRGVTAGRTTIVVAHRLSTVRHADLIYVLDEGQLREQGRHDDLIRAGGVYAGLWRLQTGEAYHDHSGFLPA